MPTIDIPVVADPISLLLRSVGLLYPRRAIGLPAGHAPYGRQTGHFSGLRHVSLALTTHGRRRFRRTPKSALAQIRTERWPMSQTIAVARYQSDPRNDLQTNAGELRAPLQGDFARGQRHAINGGHSYGDFATGMRTTSISGVVGDFATGMRTSHRQTTLGDFATGMRILSSPVVANRLTSPVSALPMAA